jgi:hypothetical protein
MSESRKRNIIVEVAYSEKKVKYDGTLIAKIAENAKLTKADAGRLPNERIEDWFSVSHDAANCGSETECPQLEAKHFGKRVNLG